MIYEKNNKNMNMDRLRQPVMLSIIGNNP